PVARAVAKATDAKEKGKGANVVGVSERAVLVAGGHRSEVGTPAGTAYTDHDLYLLDTTSGIGYVGGLVTPGHCPMMSDPRADPKGWLASLDAIQSLHAAVLVATRGDASKLPE